MPPSKMNVEQLCYGDVLTYAPQAGYVIVAIHRKPIVLDGNQHPGFKLIGFTLFETTSFTNREVTAEEMQTQLDSGTIQSFTPKVTRRIAAY